MAISQKITKNWSQWLSLFQKNTSNIWTGFATSDIIQHNNILTDDSIIIRNEPKIKDNEIIHNPFQKRDMSFWCDN